MTPISRLLVELEPPQALAADERAAPVADDGADVQRLPGNFSPTIFHFASTLPMIFTSTPAFARPVSISQHRIVADLGS